jgi:hypothetical protein
MPKSQEREKYFVLSGTRFLPAREGDVLAGRIVRRVDEPLNGGYAPEDPRPYYMGEHAIVHLEAADETLANSDSQELRNSIFNAFTKHSKPDDRFASQLRGAPITIVTIRHQQRVFDKLEKENAEAQAMVKAMLKENSRLYMIVGYIKFGKGEIGAIAYTAIRKRSRLTMTGIQRTAVLDDQIALNFKNHGYGDSSQDNSQYLSSELLSDEDFNEILPGNTAIEVLTEDLDVELDDFDLIFS